LSCRFIRQHANDLPGKSWLKWVEVIKEVITLSIFLRRKLPNGKVEWRTIFLLTTESPPQKMGRIATGISRS
jgi:hypothetical protein